MRPICFNDRKDAKMQMKKEAVSKGQICRKDGKSERFVLLYIILTASPPFRHFV